MPRTTRKPSATAAQPSFQPLYGQIKTLILGRMQLGEWKPGDMIPSEIELAARFGVSQGTVRKAVDALAGENHVVRRQGKGTFVATHTEQAAQYRFLRLVPDTGSAAAEGPAQRRVLACARERANADVAQALQLRSGEMVTHARRLMMLGGEPTILEDAWLAGAAFKDLSAEQLAQFSGSSYALYAPPSASRPCAPTPRVQINLALRWARRCCGSSAWPTPLTTNLWNCAARSTAPIPTITAMSCNSCVDAHSVSEDLACAATDPYRHTRACSNGERANPAHTGRLCPAP
jgi:DNA-binding GntR family transcriptional regulator